MKKVLLKFVYNGEFNHTDGYKYKIGEKCNSKVECYRIVAPNVKSLFSLHDLVSVDDDEAIRIQIFLTNILQGMKSDMTDIERGLKMLEDQGIK